MKTSIKGMRAGGFAAWGVLPSFLEEGCPRSIAKSTTVALLLNHLPESNGNNRYRWKGTETWRPR